MFLVLRDHVNEEGLSFARLGGVLQVDEAGWILLPERAEQVGNILMAIGQSLQRQALPRFAELVEHDAWRRVHRKQRQQGNCCGALLLQGIECRTLLA